MGVRHAWLHQSGGRLRVFLSRIKHNNLCKGLLSTLKTEEFLGEKKLHLGKCWALVAVMFLYLQQISVSFGEFWCHKVLVQCSSQPHCQTRGAYSMPSQYSVLFGSACLEPLADLAACSLPRALILPGASFLPCRPIPHGLKG